VIQAKILVLRFSSIGDIVLTSPVLRILQEQLEGGAEIHFVVKSKFQSVVQSNPRISKIFTFEKTIQEVIPDLLLEEYDYIIDLQNNVRSRIIKKRLKALAFSVDQRNFAKLLWIQFGIQGSIPHIVERYMATLKVLGLKDDGKGLEFYIPSADQLPNPWGEYTAVPIGATYFGKKPDVQHWKEILARIPGKKVLLGGKEDIEAANQIEGSSDVFNEVGKWSLAQSASLIQQSKLVVCGDTGLMHIASAFSKPIVSIWGCTRPNLGMSPWRPGESSVAIIPKNRGDRPCSKLGNKCKYGENDRCIHHIELDELQPAVERILL
jgi:heptosyltransferase-2